VPKPSPACPDCKVPMDSGFIVDFYGNSFNKQSSWVGGTAEPRRWGSVSGDKQRLPIVTFRCATCGQLKSFAHET
jgi:hypothetical protein